jgi:hypothetical protein
VFGFPFRDSRLIVCDRKFQLQTTSIFEESFSHFATSDLAALNLCRKDIILMKPITFLTFQLLLLALNLALLTYSQEDQTSVQSSLLKRPLLLSDCCCALLLLLVAFAVADYQLKS